MTYKEGGIFSPLMHGKRGNEKYMSWRWSKVDKEEKAEEEGKENRQKGNDFNSQRFIQENRSNKHGLYRA